MKNNFLLQSDSYKAGHSRLYKPGTEAIYSYLESRGGRFEKTLFFGLQYYLKEYLQGQVVTKDMIDEADQFWAEHFGRKDYFDRSKWDYILDKYNGKLPIVIKAVKEGALVPTNNVLMTIENTDPNCYWLTNFVETLLMKIWYPITIATQSYNIKKDILDALKESGTPESIGFRTHDFSYRGCPSEESAAIGAASHLLSFMGTDSVCGIRLLQEYYGAKMCGFSVPASEHSNVCSFGPQSEVEFCENYLNLYPDGLIACVSDTYDIYNACENIWGGVLKDKVLARNGTLVVRPDSGDFFEVIPKILEILYRKLGGTVNDKGYKVLCDKAKIIQGDGMKPETIKALYQHIIKLGWSADNLTVGSGGGLLVENVTRDSCKFAIKASAAKINGEWIDIFKNPITDPGKMSKKGKLALIHHGEGEWTTVPECLSSGANKLETVFENGEIKRFQTLEEIKANIN